MPFYADLHVHSKFARATSPHSDLEHMALWASKKGIAVIGTGDFTHPRWFAEIKEKLVPAEPGLFRLRDDIAKDTEKHLPVTCGQTTRFMLEVEISTIYKKGDKTRKIHHLIYVPDLEKAERLIQRLSRIGNLTADGRPILGLDSRDLLEITLESGEGSYLIPAHIWTPWFAVLGSKSGFDNLEDCYGDLTQHIFALETGLSSDPPMNRRISSLDRYQLVSNSDAHSPSKLGREACVFNTRMDYFSMRHALETGEGYGGTVEFFPEEGKYHMDGHRNCGISLEPEQTRKANGLCPVCGKALTLGVMHRVAALADRSEPIEDPIPFRSFIPLTEMLSEVQECGPNTKKVQRSYENLVAELGSELFILEHAPIEDIQRVGSSLIAEGIKRMRAGKVKCEAGFDGQFGTIRLFNKDELTQGMSVGLLFDLPPTKPEPKTTLTLQSPPLKKTKASKKKEATPPSPLGSKEEKVVSNSLKGLDPEQCSAATVTKNPLLIIAGPGAGKTRTLTHRIAHLINDHKVPPQECLAITFTNRAANEMHERLKTLLPETGERVPVMTFHALAYTLLKEHASKITLPPSFRIANLSEQIALLREIFNITAPQAKTWLGKMERLKQRDSSSYDPETSQHIDHYQRERHQRGLLNFDDLIELAIQVLESNEDVLADCHKRYAWVSIDEYQDIDARQYRLVQLLLSSTANLCVIGDPDQGIYGFRGTDIRFFEQFKTDFPQAQIVQLFKNYRSSKTIVDASLQLIAPTTCVTDRQSQALNTDTTKITIHTAPSDKAEAEFVVHTIEKMIGGSTFFSMDSGRVGADDTAYSNLSFSDFAVLYRTKSQTKALCEAFSRSGIPFQKHSHQPLIEQPAIQQLLNALEQTPAESPLIDRLMEAERVLEQETLRELESLFPAILNPLAQRCGHELNRFQSELALSVESDLWDPRADRVSLLTLHASKGLEFKVVFMVGCEQGLLPLSWGSEDPDNLAEERRLFFVGMTRAQDRLLLSHAERRLRQGRLCKMSASSFLRDIEKKLIEQEQHKKRRVKSPSLDRQLELF